jgi:hypothetical protein
VDESSLPQGPLSLGPVPPAVYVAMFGGTVGGQIVGMTADALVLGRRLVWVPVACSVVLEAVVGARLGAARLGRPLTSGECARVSAYYSLGLGAVTLPLAVWSVAYLRSLAPGASAHGVLAALGVGVVALLGATAVRPIMMVLLSRGAPR